MQTETKKTGGAKKALGIFALLLGTATVSGGGMYYVATGQMPTIGNLMSSSSSGADMTTAAGSPSIQAPQDTAGELRVVAPAVTLVEDPVVENTPSADILTEAPADVMVSDEGLAEPMPVETVKIDPIAEALLLSPAIAETIEMGRILPPGVSAVEWSQQNMGYVGKAQKGDVIPGLERVESAPDDWIVGDEESEGGGAVAPRYFSLSGPISFGAMGEIIVDETQITLSGVVIPSADAQCYAGDGEAYDCMAWAQAGLNQHIAGKMAVCSVSEMMAENYALCDVMISDDGRAVDLASWAVSAGMALANDVPARSLYHPQEADAKARGAGLWEGSFMFAGRQEGEIPVTAE